ncbi:MAG: hypothetical protein R3F54_28740 [Alphaproteobacteria bacterium]
MADTQSAPAGNSANGPVSIAAALDLVDSNPGLLGDFLDMDLDDDRDTGGDTTVTDKDQALAQSEGDDDTTITAEEDDQATEQSDEESEADEPFELFTIGKDGKREKVDLDDLEVPVTINGEDQLLGMAELRKGYLRQADYTRKTQEVAERVEREAEAAREELSADFSERMKHVDDVLAVFGSTFDREPSFEQLKAQYGGDDAKAWQAMKSWRAMADKVSKARELAAKRDREAEEAASRETVKAVQRTISTLRETVPEWRDQAKFEAESGAMRQFMLSNGLGDDDIIGVLQKPAYVLLMRDAMYGQSLRQKKPDVRARRRAAPTAVNTRSGALDKPTGDDRQRAQLRKRVRSGQATKADAIAMIEASLPDDF